MRKVISSSVVGLVVAAAILAVGGFFRRPSQTTAGSRQTAPRTVQSRIPRDQLAQLAMLEGRPRALIPASAPSPSVEHFDASLFSVWVDRTRDAIPITDEEKSNLIKACLDQYAIMSAFEQSIADVSISDNQLIAQIPPYPAAGKRLQEMLHEEFVKVLGATRASRIEQALSDEIAGQFNQFGNAWQTVHARIADARAANPVFEVRRRSEWATETGAKSSTAVTRFTAEQLGDGDFAVFSNQLRSLTSARSQ